MNEKNQDLKDLAKQAIADPETMKELVENLSGASRRVRQSSATCLGLVARENIEILVEHSAAFVDALNRPEAQTRWECLDILTKIISFDSRACDKAIPGAESALFDEESGPVRLAAMRFMCRLASTTEFRSERLWPFIDEGIQCYHGDLEFPDMIIAVLAFSQGKLSASVKWALAERMNFDAENAKGTLKRYANQIIENVS